MSRWSIKFKKPKKFHPVKPEIPEININFHSIDVQVQERQLNARWTPELAEDLALSHNIDAAAELLSLMNEELTREIDTHILEQVMLIRENIYWDPKNGNPKFKKPKKFNGKTTF